MICYEFIVFLIDDVNFVFGDVVLRFYGSDDLREMFDVVDGFLRFWIFWV